MEHAIHISALEDLRHFYGRRFDRVYLGAELCPWMLPTPEQLEQTLGFCARQGVAFTLVTPILTEPHLGAARSLLDRVPVGTEVVLNDWGLLRASKERELRPVLGRVLVKVKRDPRIGAADLADAELAGYLRGSNLAQPAFQRFLSEHGIARAELDNVPQGYELSLPAGLRTSLYYPYVYSSATRRCSLLASGGAALADGSCRARCGDVLLKAVIVARAGDRGADSAYFIAGPMLFFENAEQPRETTGWNLDRLVFQPRPPVRATEPGLGAIGDWNAIYERKGRTVQWGHDDPDRSLLEMVRKAVAAAPAQREAVTSQRKVASAPLLLDLGCGNGRNAVAMRAQGLDVIGLDLSMAALRQHRARDRDAPLVAADTLRLPLAAARLDGIVDSGCFHALPPERRPAYAQEVCRALAPGGWILIVARQRSPGLPAALPVFFAETVLPEWGVTPEELRALLEPALALLELHAQQGRGDESFYYALFRDARTG